MPGTNRTNHMASKQSGVRAAVSISQLLAEVDILERELSREAQRGGDFVHQLQEVVKRGANKRVEDIERNTSKIT